MIKERQKENTKSPPQGYLSAKIRKERKREKAIVQEQESKARTFLSSFPHTKLSANIPLPNQKFKTHPNKKKGKEKGSNKQEKRRRKEEGGASKQVYLQELHQTQV